MRFDVEIPALDGHARVEIRTACDPQGWSSYLGFVSDHALADTCLLLGECGLPHRFWGATEADAAAKAREFLQKQYRVVRIVW